MKYKIIALSCLTVLSPLALAASDGSKSYRDIAHKENWRFSPEFSLGAAYGLTKIKDGDFDEDENAYKLNATLKFNEFIGIEAGYIHFDDASSSNGLGKISVDPEGATLAAILSIPFSKHFSFYGKIGQLWWDAETNVETNVIRLSEDFDGTEDFWGLGAKVRLAEHLDLKLEYERFQFEFDNNEIQLVQGDSLDVDVDYASVGLQYTF